MTLRFTTPLYQSARSPPGWARAEELVAVHTETQRKQIRKRKPNKSQRECEAAPHEEPPAQPTPVPPPLPRTESHPISDQQRSQEAITRSYDRATKQAQLCDARAKSPISVHSSEAAPTHDDGFREVARPIESRHHAPSVEEPHPASTANCFCREHNSLLDEVKRLKNNFESSKIEQERLTNQLKGCQGYESELKKYMEKCNALEHELGEYKRNIEKVVGEFEKEKVSLIASAEDMDKLNKKVIEKDEELILNKEKVCEYKSENDALRMQVHGLKQVLSASGSGDVARELADTQEKMTFFQSQYYQLLSEKNYLIEQIQTANVERGALNQFQNNYYQFIQVQQQDLEALNRENMGLRQQLEMEKSQVLALKVERSKLKEEKNIMRQIYHQLKNEISRVQKLQGEVTGMSIEANRLAIIAEYNKQLGEKLQCEVAERDEKISELQGNVVKLNNAQVENARDKVALCVELTEACTLNDQLNNSLVAEHQKSAHLDESKKQLESSASMQLKALEEMQRTERAALKELLKDFKNVVMQRDNLLVAQNEYLQQISDLRGNAVIQARNIEGMNEKYINAIQDVENLDSRLKQSESDLKKLDGVIRDNQNVIKRLEDEIKQLKDQNESLESTKSYLQNTVQKLHNDLDESRKADLENRQLLRKNKKRLEILQSTLDQNNDVLMKTTKENETLGLEIAHLNQEYETLYSNYASNLATEEILKKEIQEMQASLDHKNKEIRRLEEVVAEKDLDLIQLQEYSKDLTKQLKEMQASVEDKEAQSKLLVETNATLLHLQNTLTSIQTEHKECHVTISLLTEEKRKLQGDLKAQLQEMETNCAYQKTYIEELIREYNEQKQEMEADLQILTARLDDTREEYENEKVAHRKLLVAHKDLAYKMLKCVRMLVDEKLNKEKAQSNAFNLSQKVAHSSVESTLKVVSDELEELKARINDLTSDKKNLQDVLSNLQELYKKSLAKSHHTSESHLDVVKRKPKGSITSSKSAKIITLRETKSKLQSSEERTKKLKEELEKCQMLIRDLKNNISNLNQKLTVAEFQRCEVSLRLHEIEAKLKTEQSMNTQLMDINQTIVAEILKMERENIITHYVSETLLGLIHGQQWDIMEFISHLQLQKYESILNEIDSEHKKCENLKQEVEKETNKLIAVRIATEKNIAREQVFRVIVKIFSSIFDVHYLYSEDISKSEFEDLRKLSNCKFYVVQVYISKLFQKKLINQSWMININIRNSKMCINKNIGMKRKHIDDYILTVIPFDASTEIAVVNTTLFTCFEDFFHSFKISTINIDISYHFSSYEKLSNISPLVKILQNYNSNLNQDLLKIPTIEYNFKCKCSAKHFFESVVKNCYHRLKPEVFSMFISENDTKVISVPFSIASKNDTIIKLDNTENTLNITCNLQDSHLIKKYFIEEINCQSVSIEKIWLVGLTNIKQYIRSELGQSKIDPDNLKIIYEELRKLIFDLPV
ncbi:hypothetical protein ILUMI_02409 [Ignelater luminosus]|uniref:Uncharacterized protein n=1 Tax=Ignelater luminosus TaxID=2038154 RepID=A0A8K0GGG9_IGNLU|nr:hypothetical protein ILUMI_02409 [Ignelater luminosus]